TPLDLWLYFLRHGERLDTEALPAALAAVGEMRRAMEGLQMIAQSDLERERYEARLKMQRDISTALAVARDEGPERGRQEGLDEGLERGRQEGQVIGQIHFCEGLLRRAPTPAAQLLALPLDDLKRLAQELEAELSQSTPPPS